MALTHWKAMDDRPYLGAYALEPGQEIILTIKEIRKEEVVGEGGTKQHCRVAHFYEDVKPMILNSTNSRIIEKIYNEPYIERWAGKKIQVYAGKSRFGKEKVDGLKIRERIPNDNAPQLPCENCGQLLTFANGMEPEQLAQYTRQKYGRVLCPACAIEMAKENKGKTKTESASNDQSGGTAV